MAEQGELCRRVCLASPWNGLKWRITWCVCSAPAFLNRLCGVQCSVSHCFLSMLEPTSSLHLSLAHDICHSQLPLMIFQRRRRVP